jgi:hypothetical protein
MRTHAELLAYQATLDPLRDYFLIMERPVGSFTWTFAKMDCDEKSANQKAIDIALANKTCTRIIRGVLPRMPDDGQTYATLADGDTTFMVTE